MARSQAARAGLPALRFFMRSFASLATRPTSQLGIPGVQHIIAVASGKGGVGKSTTAVNLAVALARNLGLRVGILDADVYGPSIPRLLNIHGRPTFGDGEPAPLIFCHFFWFQTLLSTFFADDKMIPLRKHGVAAMSMGFLMDEDAAAVWRGPMVMSALDTFFTKVNWGQLDCLVIDMPPGTGDTQITVSQRLALSGAVIVSTPQDLALLDARRGVTMFRKVAVPILGIVENMSYFVCGGCGAEAHVFGHGGAVRTAAEMGMDVLGEVPLLIDIREASDAGEPIVTAKPDSPAAAAYVSVAERVWARLQALDQQGASGPPKVTVK